MVEDHDLAMGKVIMNADAVMLKGTEVTALAQKVVLREDTFVYNSAAYRVPEGSVVEELVKRLPGAQVDDDGKITINGKEVKKVKVDGREFMTGDTQTAMKNLPTSIIENIKVYDEKSDLSRITGIDDGNEETVLDFSVKRGMNKGLMTNNDVAVGTHDRYSARLMGMYTKSDWRVTLMGNANNTGDRGFGGRGGGPGRGNTGLSAPKMAGANFSYEEKDKLKVDGSVRWNHNDTDSRTISSTENFVTRNGSFSNSSRQNYSRSDSWNAQMRLEWMPDSMTNIMFRPNINFSKNDSRSWSHSASFNDDPYLHVTDPLSPASIARLADEDLMVNENKNQGITYGDSKRVGGSLQLNRKLNSSGRNVTLRAEATYSEGDSRNLSTSNVHLYQVYDMSGNDSLYQTNRYRLTPTHSYNYTLQSTYSEPLWNAAFLQFSYRFNYSYNKSDQNTYDFSSFGESVFGNISPVYRGWDNYLNLLPQAYESYFEQSLSRYSEYRNYTHNIEVMFRMIRDKYNFNAGVMMQPQKSKFIQDYQGVYVDTVRNVFNVSPTLDFRYRFSRVSSLRLNYRGSTSQPSISDLLDITDDSDPLNIRKGNPGLKPSFTQSFNAFYNGYQQRHMRTYMTFVNFSTTNNSISSMVTYDEKTGGRTVKPENINGNWNVRTGVMYNMAIDTLGIWNINTFTMYGYSNHVAYVNLNQSATASKNATHDTDMSERIGLSFRPTLGEWLTEFEIDGNVNYRHTRNKLQTQSNLDTWTFSYGGSLNVTAPWGTTLAMDIHERSRRGFNDESMNTNELLWNAQISQNFLKGRPLTVMLQFYDILNQQSNFSRSVSAMSRNDTWYNSINSYAMLHVIYRFNSFGGRQARRDMRDGGADGSGGRGGGRPGGFGGGFGGGRPGGRF